MRKFHIGLAATAGAALLSISSIATVQAADTPGAGGTLDPSRVSGGTYTVDSAHTLIGWKINHVGINDYLGLFGDISGTLTIDPADLSSAKVDVMIPVSKVLTASSGLNEHLLRPGKNGAAPDFFGPSPADATFKSTQVRQTSPSEALITGVLTLNGVSQPVSLMAEFTGAGINGYTKKENIGFHGWGEIRRSDFGITAAIPIASDTVRLDITAAFEK